MLKKEEDVCNVLLSISLHNFFFSFLLFHVFLGCLRREGLEKLLRFLEERREKCDHKTQKKHHHQCGDACSECIRLLSAVITGKYDSLALSSCAIWWLAGDRFVRTRAEGCDCRASVISAVLSFASSRRFFSTKTMDDERRCSFIPIRKC